MESPRNTPACVNQNTAEMLSDRGYNIVTVESILNTSDKLDVDDSVSVELADEKLSWGKIISTEIPDDVKEIIIDDSSTPTPDDMDSIEYDAALMSILETDLVFTNKKINSDVISEARIFGYIKWPTYEVTFPGTAQVGVPFDV